MWHLSLPWWEFVLRGFIVYGTLILLLRLTGKRQIGQMSPFDLVLLLVISNAVQNAMNGGDNSVSGGLILAVTLIGCNALFNWITTHSRTVEKFIEGTPEVLIFDGKVMKKALEREGLSMEELEGAVRVAGYESLENIHLATLELNGRISVVGSDHCEGETPKMARLPRTGRKPRRRTTGG